MPSSWTQSYFHLVFSTHKREPLIQPTDEDRLYAFIGGIARDINCTLIAAGGMPDHVHLLVRAASDVSLATIAKETKARSSAWIHEDWHRAEFGWQRGYGGFTVSRSALADVERYIRGQKDHRKRQTFQEEFLSLLRLHDVEFDERYVFE
ncbi:MAG: IS200/IS605 family transposase [Phycisphaerales bacterium]